LLFFLSLTLISCEKESYISYNVHNKSTQQIKILFFNTDGYNKETYNKLDSIFIESDSKKLIVVQGKGTSRVSNYKETETHLREFSKLEIYQQNIKSVTDFSLSSEWGYKEEDKDNASYTCEVHESDF